MSSKGIFKCGVNKERRKDDQVEKNILFIIETTDANLLTKFIDNYFKAICVLGF